MALHQLDGVVHAPEFPLGCTWLNIDAPLTLAKLQGKVVLLDFWTLGCINCMHVLPELKQLEKKYGDALVVIGVHSGKFEGEKQSDAIKKAIVRYEIEHPVINDADFEIWKAYGIRAWPSFMLINPSGRIVGTHSGEGVLALFDKLIGRVIQHFDDKGTLIRSPRIEQVARDKNEPLLFPGKIFATPDRLVIADSNHNRVLLTDLEGRVREVIGCGEAGNAEGSFARAKLRRPQGVCLVGNCIYVADTENHVIKEADLTTDVVRTVLGTGEQARRFNEPGTGEMCALNSPWDLVVVQDVMYVAMAGAHQIWRVDIKGWHARPHMGSAREDLEDGPLLAAALAQPSGIIAQKGQLFFVDSESSAVRFGPLDSIGQVETLVGVGLFDFGDCDGVFDSARLQHPVGVTGHQELLYIADTYNHKIKVVDLTKKTATTFAGSGVCGMEDGALLDATFCEPSGISICENRLYVADTNNHAIRIVDLEAGSVSRLEVKV